MAVKTIAFRVDMRGDTHIENLTKSVQAAVADSGLRAGIVTVFVKQIKSPDQKEISTVKAEQIIQRSSVFVESRRPNPSLSNDMLAPLARLTMAAIQEWLGYQPAIWCAARERKTAGACLAGTPGPGN